MYPKHPDGRTYPFAEQSYRRGPLFSPAKGAQERARPAYGGGAATQERAAQDPDDEEDKR